MNLFLSANEWYTFFRRFRAIRSNGSYYMRSENVSRYSRPRLIEHPFLSEPEVLEYLVMHVPLQSIPWRIEIELWPQQKVALHRWYTSIQSFMNVYYRIHYEIYRAHSTFAVSRCITASLERDHSCMTNHRPCYARHNQQWARE